MGEQGDTERARARARGGARGTKTGDEGGETGDEDRLRPMDRHSPAESHLKIVHGLRSSNWPCCQRLLWHSQQLFNILSSAPLAIISVGQPEFLPRNQVRDENLPSLEPDVATPYSVRIIDK